MRRIIWPPADASAARFSRRLLAQVEHAFNSRHPRGTVMLEALTLHLIREHGGITVTVSEAAEILGISKDHAYVLAAQRRFPVLGITGVRSDRESMRVLIPHLVEWMYAGGTQQYDPAPAGATPTDDTRGRGASLDPELAWLDAQLAAAPGAGPDSIR